MAQQAAGAAAATLAADRPTPSAAAETSKKPLPRRAFIYKAGFASINKSSLAAS